MVRGVFRILLCPNPYISRNLFCRPCYLLFYLIPLLSINIVAIPPYSFVAFLSHSLALYSKFYHINVEDPTNTLIRASAPWYVQFQWSSRELFIDNHSWGHITDHVTQSYFNSGILNFSISLSENNLSLERQGPQCCHHHTYSLTSVSAPVLWCHPPLPQSSPRLSFTSICSQPRLYDF